MIHCRHGVKTFVRKGSGEVWTQRCERCERAEQELRELRRQADALARADRGPRPY